MEALFNSLGLENVIPIAAIKATIDNVVENPNQLLKDVIGVDIEAIVNNVLAQIPEP